VHLGHKKCNWLQLPVSYDSITKLNCCVNR